MKFSPTVTSERERRVNTDSANESEVAVLHNSRHVSLSRARVHFSVLSAKLMIPSRTGLFCFKPRLQNPFAVFTYQSVHEQTSVERQTSSPVWNMSLVELGVIDCESEDFIKIKVYDRMAMRKKNLIGSVVIPSERLLRNGEGNHQRWMKIYNGGENQEKSGKTAIGDLLIKFRNDPIQ
eukprot:g8007.t1